MMGRISSHGLRNTILVLVMFFVCIPNSLLSFYLCFPSMHIYSNASFLAVSCFKGPLKIVRFLKRTLLSAILYVQVLNM